MKHLQACLSVLSRLPRWLEILLALVLLWQGASLFWLLFGPAQRHGNLAMPVPVPLEQPFIPSGLARWFEAPKTEAAAPVNDLRLVLLVSGRNGVAVIAGAPGGDIAVKEGGEVMPGTRLKTIRTRSVVLEQGGAERILELPAADVDSMVVPYGKAANAPSPAAPANPPPVAAPAAPKEAPPETVARGQLGNMMQSGNLGAWSKGLASYRDGGILVENADEQMLSKTLKLKNGDVMKTVNGRPISQLADISLVYNFFSQQSSVELSVLRDGSLQTLRYQIQP